MHLNFGSQPGCFGIVSDALDRRFRHRYLQVLFCIIQHGREDLADVAHVVRFPEDIAV